MKVLILGGGRIGATISRELSKEYRVTVTDIDKPQLETLEKCFGVNGVNCNVSNKKALKNLLPEFDLVVGALPGHLGYETAKTVLEAGKNMVDISFFQQDTAPLDEIARRQRCTLVVDAGIAPGISNMILGYHYNAMQVTKYECLVGGLPKKREWPWEYKAVFSPRDVIEEYIRPARFMQNGKLVTKEALSDIELVDFDRVGTLEAFNTDGLRTLLKTVKVPDMIEKTLRYPGTTQFLKALKKSGFFSVDTLHINDIKLSPLSFTSALLEENWKLHHGEEDFTILRSTIYGKHNKSEVAYRYSLYDEYDKKTDIHSMAKTTGYTCSAIAKLMLEGAIKGNGVLAPEQVAMQDGLFAEIMSFLEERGVVVEIEQLY